MRKFVLINICLLLTNYLLAQAEELLPSCSHYFTKGYIQDGQQYFSMIKDNSTVEFNTTFFGRNQYRLVVCSSQQDARVKFILYDTEKNILYNSSDFNYSPYWDFQFKSTVDCIVEIQFSEKITSAAYVMMMIGFKEQY